MATLSYTDKFAWYGLRENPTYDQMLHTVRKPVRLPIPSREAKWYALSPYRAFLLDAQKKYNDYDARNIEYDGSNGHLPRSAARMGDSEAGNDPAWGEHDRFNAALDHEEAAQIAAKAMDQERKQRANAMRQEQLQVYGPTMIHPTIEAHHEDLDSQDIPHVAPVPKPNMSSKHWPFPPQEYQAAGYPQPPEFPTFEQLNLGQAKRYKQGKPGSMDSTSYESLRKNTIG